MAEVEMITVSSKGQVTIPSRLRRKLGIGKGERLLVARQGNAIRLIPVPRLSKLAGVDEGLFRGRRPSAEIEAARKEWTEESEASRRIDEIRLTTGKGRYSSARSVREDRDSG